MRDLVLNDLLCFQIFSLYVQKQEFYTKICTEMIHGYKADDQELNLIKLQYNILRTADMKIKSWPNWNFQMLEGNGGNTASANNKFPTLNHMRCHLNSFSQ